MSATGIATTVQQLDAQRTGCLFYDVVALNSRMAMGQVSVLPFPSLADHPPTTGRMVQP